MCAVFWIFEPPLCQLGSYAEADDSGDIFGASAFAQFLRADEHWFDSRATAQHERADTFGAVHLVGGTDEHIDGES